MAAKLLNSQLCRLFKSLCHGLRIGCSTTELPRLINYLRDLRTAFCVFCVVLALFLRCSKPSPCRVKAARCSRCCSVGRRLTRDARLSSWRSLIQAALSDSDNGATEIVRGEPLYAYHSGPVLLRLRLAQALNLSSPKFQDAFEMSSIGSPVTLLWGRGRDEGLAESGERQCSAIVVW